MSTIRPLKLAVFFDQVIHAGGGYQQALNAALLVKQLPQDLVEPIFFTHHKINISTLNDLGIKVVMLTPNLSLFSRALLKLRRSISNTRLLELWRKIAGLNAFEQCFVKHGVDLVYFLTPSKAANDLEDLNYITTLWDLCHRDDLEFPEVRAGRIFELREQHYRTILSKAVAILVESPLGKVNVTRRYGIDKERVHVMPLTPAIGTKITDETYHANYIDIHKKYQMDVPYVFYPAQFWSHKNHVYLLEGLKCLEVQFGQKVGAIFSGGDQGNLAHVRRTAGQLGVNDRVCFAGFVTNEEIPYLYKQSLALVMPTYFGPTNLPPLEAFILGVPVLYPDKEGLREQVGNAALLMDLRNPASMAGHLANLLSDEKLRNDLVNNGKERVSLLSDTDRLEILVNIMADYRARRSCWG